MNAPCIVILAAGRGRRMHSALPKVLHLLGSRPLLEHVIQTALALSPEPPVIVTGHGETEIRRALAQPGLRWVTQTEQRGTGHALQTALPLIPAGAPVLVLCGDMPLVTAETLQRLINTTPPRHPGLVTVKLTDPAGFGRIVRDNSGRVTAIVEEKDATASQQTLTEISAGIWLVPQDRLRAWLPTLTADNAQGELYLTDIIPRALADNLTLHTVSPLNAAEITGINTRADLARAERIFQRREAEKLMQQGVTLRDPARTDIRGRVTAGQDVTIDVGVILEGTVTLGSNVQIGPHCVLRNVSIGDNTEIRACSVIDEASIGRHCIVGPFARIRPGTQLDNHSLIGNFVEIKNSHIGQGSKVNHLSYVGDCSMGKKVNVGAGVITCNYDGAKKHKTQIGDSAFIGSNAALVAPLAIHSHATIGAGSVVTQDAPAGQLTLARTRQRTVPGWQRPGQTDPATPPDREKPASVTGEKQ